MKKILLLVVTVLGMVTANAQGLFKSEETQIDGYPVLEASLVKKEAMYQKKDKRGVALRALKSGRKLPSYAEMVSTPFNAIASFHEDDCRDGATCGVIYFIPKGTRVLKITYPNGTYDIVYRPCGNRFSNFREHKRENQDRAAIKEDELPVVKEEETDSISQKITIVHDTIVKRTVIVDTVEVENKQVEFETVSVVVPNCARGLMGAQKFFEIYLLTGKFPKFSKNIYGNRSNFRALKHCADGRTWFGRNWGWVVPTVVIPTVTAIVLSSKKDETTPDWGHNPDGDGDFGHNGN